MSFSTGALRRTLTTTLAGVTIASAAHLGAFAPLLSAFDGRDCYLEIAEDGSADHYCQSGDTVTKDASWSPHAWPADGDWHFCGGTYGYGDPVCSAPHGPAGPPAQWSAPAEQHTDSSETAPTDWPATGTTVSDPDYTGDAYAWRVSQ